MKLKQNIAISENGFVFDPTSGESYSMNKTAIELMKYLNDNVSIDTITSEFLKKYDVDENTFERYYLDFINMLKDYKLIMDDGEN